MKITPTLLVPVCGAALALAGAAILRVNPPLPPSFGGSFHGNIKELSLLADRIGMVAIVLGCGLLVLGPLRSAIGGWLAGAERADSTAAPTSPAPSRRSPPSG